MVSTSDIAFEPPVRKIWVVTNSIFVMTSGDAALQAEVLTAVQNDVAALLTVPNIGWLTVQHVTNLYVSRWNDAKRSRAEAALLAPLGLTSASFIDRQRLLDASVAEKITNAIIGFQLPSASCIVTGVDEFGPHIFVVDNGVQHCEDSIGFATIGSGGRHASSQLMLAQYSPAASPPEALVLVHLAKKRAEVAPGVGAATDLFMIQAELGHHRFLTDDFGKKLDADYLRLQKKERRATDAAIAEFGKHLAGLPKEPDSGQQSA